MPADLHDDLTAVGTGLQIQSGGSPHFITLLDLRINGAFPEISVSEEIPRQTAIGTARGRILGYIDEGGEDPDVQLVLPRQGLSTEDQDGLARFAGLGQVLNRAAPLAPRHVHDMNEQLAPDDVA